jgi:SAM-dependent methyltransferase
LLRINDRFKDFLRGIKTEGLIELDELGIDPSLGGRYETTSYKTLNHVLKIAKKKGFDSMIDIGCGNGRSLVVANEVGFTNLFGVDISSDLIAICEQNLKKLGISAHLKACDVSKYGLPDRDLVIFLFNPFGAERMANLVKELIKRKNRYLVIYANPKHLECFPSEPSQILLNKHFGMYNEVTHFYDL